MSLQFAYYPGCAAKQVQKEADWAARAVSAALGITLNPMPNATCCGAVSLRESKPAFSLAVAARILSEAEAKGTDLATICNTCLQTLSHANYRFKQEEHLLDEINKVNQQAGVRPYQGTINVRHLLWVITDQLDADVLRKKITRPLRGLRVAPFYGCHGLRPEHVHAVSKAGATDHLDRLIALMGGEAVSYDGRERCCGFHVMLSDKREMRQMVTDNCLSAKDSGAELMITPCTLCDMAMGAYQGIAEQTLNQRIELPEMNFAQLLGLAMGIDANTLGISRLHVDPRPVLKARGIL
jgi:succinate dehydrogenase / fumarate reductase cytochrome b subunit